MDDAMANQFSLESSRNSTSEVTVGRLHPVELLNTERYVSKRGHTKNMFCVFNNIIFVKSAVRTIRPFKSVQL